MSSSSDGTRASANEARSAGRGVIYVALAKMYFMIAGAIIEFRLPAILANTVFGAYAVVASTVSPLNNVLVTGSIQAVSRFTAQADARARAIQRAGFRMQLYVGLPVALAFVAMAPVFAHFFHDASKTGPLMLAGAIVAGYAFYAVFVGTVNGRREFHKQAGLDMCFATFRAIGILGLAMAGFGLYGAISGWVGAVGAILVVASLVVGWPGREARAQEREPVQPMLRFFASVGVYLILLNLLMFVDQLLLKRLAAEWYAAHQAELLAGLRGLLPDDSLLAVIGYREIDPAHAADGQVGYYRAVQNLARLSYQFIIAGMFVIFPLVSRATFENDTDTTRRYIHTTTRYSLIFATAIAVLFAANPGPLLDIPYPADYAYFGAPALVVLALGNVAFSLFAIQGTILNGAGYTRQAILVAGVTLACAAAANWLAIPRFDPGRDALLAAACATSGAMLLGACLGGYMLHRHLGAFIPWLSVVRVPVAAAAAIFVGRQLPYERPLMTLVEAALVGLAFLFTLIITGELSRRDLAAVRSLAGRKAASSQPTT